jgi:D-alanine-D-alanine ligase
LPEAEHALRNFVRTHRKVAFKPVADGSSYGLIIIDDDTKLAEALKQLEESPQTPQLVETFIEGTELSVGVIDDADGPRALPGTEIRVQQGQLFGYDEKYLMSGVEMTPPEVPEAIIHAGQRLAVAAHTAFGCVGYSRVDLIVDDHGAVFLELNTLPGLTASSMVPAQLAAKGMSLHAFCERQITLAESRTSFRASQNNP